ncbi:uncharacterized protein LOC129247420 isoform X1 [Anastrepha obliqua]|uniref:uncharacterized protein LOC129247420 isoform X1 n=1 Tax=Anastrepha obliqua TaxID=95512 RepID=UPI00240A4D55|nr:uncharacterized protein LOC129247420 isoform X1 [Anastrepha obliqua]
MSEQLSNIICNGELEIVKITENLYDEAVKLFTENFIQKENISLATRLLNSPQAVKELQSMCRAMLQENTSFAARNISNGELAAIAVTHLMSSQPENATLGDVMNSMQSPEMKCISEFLQAVETSADVYKAFQIDCVLEIVFLSTSANYLKRGLASTLSEYSINYARHLLQGTVPEVDLPAAQVRALKPRAVCSVFTSLYTQRIGRKLNFEILKKLPYTEFSFRGQTFAERIDPIHEFVTFEALRL